MSVTSLKDPPCDTGGNVTPHDHDGIRPQDGIIRRVPEHWVVEDAKTPGRSRLSSMAFKASSGPNGGMSVDLQQQIEEAGLDAKQYVTTPRWVGSVRFTAGALRDEGYMVGFDPVLNNPDYPDNPYHGQVWGSFSKGKQRRLKKLCDWFVPIEGVSIS